MIQHFATLPTYWAGDKYNLHRVVFGGNVGSILPPTLQGTLKTCYSKLRRIPADANLHHITQVVRVIMYHRLTDLYGDIPYSEAGRGFLEGNYAAEI